MKNKKFLIVFIIIILVIAGLIGLHIYNKYFCYTEISSINNSFKVTVPNKVNFKIKESNEENYSLDFYSVKDEMFFYSTVIEKETEIDLKNIVNKEKEGLNAKLNNLNITSDVEELNINTYKSYKYSYTYSDVDYGNDLYSEVVWIETDSRIYILNLEVITKNMEKYKSIFEKIENSFNEL